MEFIELFSKLLKDKASLEETNEKIKPLNFEIKNEKTNNGYIWLILKNGRTLLSFDEPFGAMQAYEDGMDHTHAEIKDIADVFIELVYYWYSIDPQYMMAYPDIVAGPEMLPGDIINLEDLKDYDFQVMFEELAKNASVLTLCVKDTKKYTRGEFFFGPKEVKNKNFRNIFKYDEIFNILPERIITLIDAGELGLKVTKPKGEMSDD